MSDTHSLYQAPQAALVDQNLPSTLVPASLWLRFANYWIDTAVNWLLLVLATLAVSSLMSEQQSQRIFESLYFNLAGIVVMVCYYIVMEALWGRTLGKLVTGTRVVDENGGEARLGQIIGRSFARLIPFEIFSYFGEEKRGWHDSLPRTRVIKCR